LPRRAAGVEGVLVATPCPSGWGWILSGGVLAEASYGKTNGDPPADVEELLLDERV
jgi:hypothetical protein